MGGVTAPPPVGPSPRWLQSRVLGSGTDLGELSRRVTASFDWRGGARAPGRSAFTHSGPPPAERRQLGVVWLRQSTALQLFIDARDQSAQVPFGSRRKVPHRPLQVITGIVYPGRAEREGIQVPARLIESPLDTREGSSDRVGPHLLVFDPTDRCTSPRGYTMDPQNRTLPSWPPPLCTDGLGAPTRHRPFGST